MSYCRKLRLMAVAVALETVQVLSQVEAVWQSEYGLPNSWNSVWALEFDSAGHSYLAGWASSTSISKYALLKFDGEGRQVWVRNYGPNESQWGYPSGLAIDPQGNPIITGLLGTLKYDALGQLLWARPKLVSSALAMDSSGNMYVGQGQTLKKISPEGLELWSVPSGYVQKIRIDREGNLVASGGGTAKYDATGTLLWQKHDFAMMTIDAEGFIYSAKREDRAIVTTKHASDGRVLWVAREESPGRDNSPRHYPQVKEIEVDSAGHVYVLLAAYGRTAGALSTLRKYDSSGQGLWVARDYSSGAPAGIAVDESGSAYVIGTTVVDGVPAWLTAKFDCG